GYTYDNHLRSPSFSSRVSLWVYDTVLILNPYRWALLIYHLFSKETHVIKPSTEFIIPLPKFASYPGESVSYKEIMWKPESNQFTKFWDSKFYEDWNGEVLVDFKWRTFGKDYYFFIWTVYTIFLLTFTLVATEPSNIDFSEFLLWVSILLGSFQLSIE
ncbi:3151_t:CDS:1, partial [Acaulospora morrowiae]